jgi:hypothetical protein
MSADLEQAIYRLLTPTRFVIDRHGNDGHHHCRSCGAHWPCFELGTAIAALDLVLRVHVAARRQPDGSMPAAFAPTTSGRVPALAVDDPATRASAP